MSKKNKKNLKSIQGYISNYLEVTLPTIHSYLTECREQVEMELHKIDSEKSSSFEEDYNIAHSGLNSRLSRIKEYIDDLKFIESQLLKSQNSIGTK